MEETKYITIYKKGDVHIVDMLQKNVLTPKTEIHVDRKFIEDICQEINRITLMANRMIYEGKTEYLQSEIVDNLKNTGSFLFKHLFPDDIQKALSDSQNTDLCLRLDEKLLHIPWELCFDGEDFLSLKFRIGRQVITGKKPNTFMKGSDNNGITMLIIIDPSETLKYAQREAELLFSILEKETDIKIEIIGGKHADKLHLLKEMKSKDVVHFIGHSFYDESHPEKSGWVLKKGILTSEDISRMDMPPCIVFSNSCQSLAVSSQEGYLFDEKSFGVGGGFMVAGVRNFIGSIWVIHDEDSVKFAADFYRVFLGGKPLGESLNEARKNAIKNKGLSNLHWASFIHYGDPAYSLKDSRISVEDDVQEKVGLQNSMREPYSSDKYINDSTKDTAFPAALLYPESNRFKKAVFILLIMLIASVGGYYAFPGLQNKISDSFRNKFVSNYHPVSGPWGWKDGRYTLLTDYWDGEAISFIGNDIENFIVELTAYQGQPAWPDAGFGVIIARDDMSDAIIFYLSDETMGWIVQKDGRRGNMSSETNLSFPNKAHIKITGINSNYAAYINGTKVSQITHPLKTVRAGLLIDSRWKVSPGFNEIKIERLEGK